jgi:hypothetical protein
VEASGIQLLVEARSHRLFGRGNLVALVTRTAEGGDSIGSTGILLERGLAYLVWRKGRAWLAGKGFEQAATDEQVAQMCAFSEELKAIVMRS